MKTFTSIVLGLLIPSISFAAPLTVTQANSLISVVQSSTSTPASAFVPLITAFSNITIPQAESLINVVQQAPGVPATSFVNMLVAFTVDTITPTVVPTTSTSSPSFGSTQPASNTKTAQIVTSTPVCDDTPTLTYQAWLTGIDRPTKLTSPIIVSANSREAIQYTITVTSCLQENWNLTISYPYYNYKVGQKDIVFNSTPNKSLDDDNLQAGGISLEHIGKYVSTIVATDGKTTATSTIPIVIQ